MRNLSDNERRALDDLAIDEMLAALPIVVDDDRIVNDPDGESPYAERGRPAEQRGGEPFNIAQRARAHLLSGAIPSDPLEFNRYLDGMVEAVRALRRDGPGALAGQRQQLGISRLALTYNGYELAENDAEVAESERDAEGSQNRTLQMIGTVLDGLDKAAGKGSDPVKAEARGLLRTIITNAELSLKRQRDRGADAGQVGQRRSVEQFAEESPNFATMNLSRPQTDAQAEAIVDEMFSRKFHRAAK